MANFNKVFLMGNLTRDPELRYTTNGTAVASFGIAVNRYYTANEEKKEEVCFVDCAAFGKSAETLTEYVKKGRPLFVEGRLQFRQWETEDGQKQSKLSVVVESFQFIGSGEKVKSKNETNIPAGTPDVAQEDIPF